MSIAYKILVALTLALSMPAFIMPAYAETAATFSSNVHSGFGTSGTSYGGSGNGGSAAGHGGGFSIYGSDYAPKFSPNPWYHCYVGNNPGYFVSRGLSASNILGHGR